MRLNAEEGSARSAFDRMASYGGGKTGTGERCRRRALLLRDKRASTRSSRSRPPDDPASICPSPFSTNPRPCPMTSTVSRPPGWNASPDSPAKSIEARRAHAGLFPPASSPPRPPSLARRRAERVWAPSGSPAAPDRGLLDETPPERRVVAGLRRRLVRQPQGRAAGFLFVGRSGDPLSRAALSFPPALWPRAGDRESLRGRAACRPSRDRRLRSAVTDARAALAQARQRVMHPGRPETVRRRHRPRR